MYILRKTQKLKTIKVSRFTTTFHNFALKIKTDWVIRIVTPILSSNVNEVIRAVLNFLLFFYENISHASKAPKAPKAQRRIQAKAQKRK